MSSTCLFPSPKGLKLEIILMASILKLAYYVYILFLLPSYYCNLKDFRKYIQFQENLLPFRYPECERKLVRQVATGEAGDHIVLYHAESIGTFLLQKLLKKLRDPLNREKFFLPLRARTRSFPRDLSARAFLEFYDPWDPSPLQRQLLLSTSINLLANGCYSGLYFDMDDSSRYDTHSGSWGIFFEDELGDTWCTSSGVFGRSKFLKDILREFPWYSRCSISKKLSVISSLLSYKLNLSEEPNFSKHMLFSTFSKKALSAIKQSVFEANEHPFGEKTPNFRASILLQIHISRELARKYAYLSMIFAIPVKYELQSVSILQQTPTYIDVPVVPKSKFFNSCVDCFLSREVKYEKKEFEPLFDQKPGCAGYYDLCYDEVKNHPRGDSLQTRLIMGQEFMFPNNNVKIKAFGELIDDADLLEAVDILLDEVISINKPNLKNKMRY